jgi:hypothetical protein
VLKSGNYIQIRQSGRGKEDDGKPRCFRVVLDSTAHFETVEIGKVDIQKNKVGSILSDSGERFCAGPRFVDDKTRTSQEAGTGIAPRVMIVNV